MKILLANERTEEHERVSRLIATQLDWCVGHARNSSEMIELSRCGKPDIVVIDFNIPIKRVIEAMQEIHRLLPRTHVLVLASAGGDDALFEAMRAGARAGVSRGTIESDLLPTICALSRGHSRLTPLIARKIMEHFQRLALVTQSDAYRHCTPWPSSVGQGELTGAQMSIMLLSEEEMQTLERIADAESTRHVASPDVIQEGHVTATHVNRVVDKLQSNARVVRAILEGGIAIRQTRSDPPVTARRS